MQHHHKSIHVNNLPAGIREGIFIARQFMNGEPNDRTVDQSHRDNGHVFILQEEGTTQIEIDFVIYTIQPGSIVYINPSQIHRLISFDNATFSSWIITNENLRPEFLKLLETLVPTATLNLESEALFLITQAVNLSIQFLNKIHEKLFDTILKESINTLVALTISQLQTVSQSVVSRDRSDVITKAFKALLEEKFQTLKSPGQYAEALHVSASYLNECVKSSTGEPVSYHIQERIILEAKRLLHHSDWSVKEIAVELGYDDYSYFNRLFVKVTGMTPVSFKKHIRK